VLCARVRHLDRYCYIAALGVAHRVSGRGLAGEALDQVQVLMADYGFRSDFLVDALIDAENSAAQSAFSGRGYVVVGEEGRYSRWARMF
jgi:ribosomal protein S18 acetylase RimI-like enzyme